MEKMRFVCISVQFNRSVVSDSLWSHGLQHARPPWVYSNSCSLSQWCHPTISTSVVPFSSHLRSFPASKSFQKSLRIRWPKYWSFSFNISPSSEYSGLISLKIDWFDLLAVQGTFRSLFQHNSLKASILWHSAFFIVQLSHPYMTTGKTRALTRWTFVGKVMSLCLCFLICCLGLSSLSCQEATVFWSWLQDTVCTDLGAQEEEICHYFHISPFCLPRSNGARCHRS